MASLCLKSIRCLNKTLLKSINKTFNPSLTDCRYLFSNTALGIDNYLRAKERTKLQFDQIEETFKQKMVAFTSDDSKNMVFTEDLKNMLYLTENSDADLSLLEKMMVKFNKQNKELRFGTFVFGPVAMRMYYNLNKPIEAFKAFKNPDLEGFFDQVMSYQILMDLLFNNKMYEEIKEVFEFIKERQLMGAKFHKNTVILVVAACYKINSPESWAYVKNLWSAMQEIGHIPTRKTVTFAAGIALAQNEPHVALELLTLVPKQNYVTVRNLKVAALADIGRPEDAILVLRGVLERDYPQERKQTFSDEAIEKLRAAVERSGNKDIATEFNRIEQQLSLQHQIDTEPLDKQLSQEIHYTPSSFQQQNQQNDRLAASFRNDRPQRTYRRREGLADLA